MNFKGYAEITTVLPDDIVQTDDEIVTYPGRNVAQALSELLRAAGYQNIGAPEYMHIRGWDLNVEVGGKRIWLELQGVDVGEFVLQTEAKVGFIQRLLGVDLTYYAEFLTKLNDSLRDDPRFSKVEWYAFPSHMPVGEAADDPLKVMDWRG